MSISHKAYLFDVKRFEEELAKILYRALETDDAEPLRQFILRNRRSLRSLWTAQPLNEETDGTFLLEYLGGSIDAATGEFREDPALNANRPLRVQRCADLALTKHYDLLDDGWGLDYGFDALGYYFESVPRLRPQTGALIGGYLFGPRGKRLDPGFMGTGLVSVEQVKKLLALLEEPLPAIPPPDSDVFYGCGPPPDSAEEVEQSLNTLRNLYRQALKEGVGILFTDFNDCGVGRM
jgi:hypothetical protein